MLELRRNGRKMSRKQFLDGIEWDIIANVEDNIERRWKSLRDPKNGHVVKVTKQCQNGDSTWKIDGLPQAVEALNRDHRGQIR